MKKYIIGGLMLSIVLLVGARIATNNPVSAAESTSSSLVILNPSHNFGTIGIFDGKVTAEYTVTNTGTEDVQILAAQTSCMCTTGEIDGLQFSMHGSGNKQVTIPAGGSKTLMAVYDPLAHGPNGTGRITRELILSTNSIETPELRALLSANVVKKK